MDHTGGNASNGTAELAARMPVLFVAHGAPTLAMDQVKGGELRRWGAVLPKPSAVLVVSAHWEDSPVTLGATVPTELIYDFYGFPEELYRLRYDAPPAPALATRIEQLLGRSVRRQARGLDHGAWVPLLHLFPEADVPVLQISMPSADGARALFELGRRLSALRDEGVLIVGSGNLTHNLGRVSFRGGSETPAWAAEFDAWIGDVLSRSDFDGLLDYKARAPALAMNHPTEEHLVPVLVAAGAAGGGSRASFPITGFEYASLSRRSVQFG